MTSARFLLGDWVALLRQGKAFYRLGELMRLSGLNEGAARQALLRLTHKGLLTRLGRGLYANLLYPGDPPTVEEVVVQLYPPCYISLESALYQHRVLDQAPFRLTCVTTNKPRNFATPWGEVSFRSLKPALFGGFQSDSGPPLAWPEKAVLDYLYLAHKSGVRPDVDEWNWELVDRAKLRGLASPYPKTLQQWLARRMGQ